MTTITKKQLAKSPKGTYVVGPNKDGYFSAVSWDGAERWDIAGAVNVSEGIATQAAQDWIDGEASCDGTP